jgi:alpha-tubulin suppressor-like RCC1 family protein
MIAKMRALLLVVLCVASCGRCDFDATDDAQGTGIDAPIVGRWAKVSTHGSGTCAITLIGELWCWGAGYDGQLGIAGGFHLQEVVQVGTSSSWTSVSTGQSHSCGLQGDALWCWGSNNYGQLVNQQPFVRVPPYQLSTGWNQVVTSDAHTCAIRSDGQLLCWGQGENSVLGTGATVNENVPQLVTAGINNWRTVATNVLTTCAIQTDDTLWCWGANSTGQVGDGTQAVRSSPVQIDATRKWKSVDVAVYHTCAIDSAGAPYCWGLDEVGEAGGTSTFVPLPVTGAPPLETIDIGIDHSCGRTAAGQMFCWGSSEVGQLGSTIATTVPALIATATAFSANDDQTCFIDQDRLHCSGRNGMGQVIPPAAEVPSATRMDTRTDWAKIAASNRHTCGLTTSGAAYCWGLNAGELGTGTKRDQQVPTNINATYTELAVGIYTIGGLAADGSVFLAGRLPDGTGSFTRVQIYPAGSTTRFVAGQHHSCRIATTGIMECGGANNAGQLGDSTNTDSPMTGPSGMYKELAARVDTTCAIDINNNILCWGDNYWGQLGNGSMTDANSPQTVSSVGFAGPPSKIYVGSFFSCALLASGEIWCWGDGGSGQFGGGVSSSTSPVKVNNRTDWVDVALGDSHLCAIAADRSLWCWGHSDDGQAGLRTEPPVTTPFRVDSANDWLDVACGDHFTCAIKSDGTRWCMGANNFGELGNGRSWTEQFTVIP